MVIITTRHRLVVASMYSKFFLIFFPEQTRYYYRRRSGSDGREGSAQGVGASGGACFHHPSHLVIRSAGAALHRIKF
jgi:hypothetical protein